MAGQNRNLKTQPQQIVKPLLQTNSTKTPQPNKWKMNVKLSWAKALQAGVFFGVVVYIIPTLLLLPRASFTESAGIGGAIAESAAVYFSYMVGLLLALVLSGCLLRLFRTQHPWVIAITAAGPLEIAYVVFQTDLSTSFNNYDIPVKITVLSLLVFAVLYALMIKAYSALLTTGMHKIVRYMLLVFIVVAIFIGLLLPLKTLASYLAKQQIINITAAPLQKAGFDIYMPTTIPPTSSIVSDSFNNSQGGFFEIWYYDFEFYEYTVKGDNYPPLNCVEPSIISTPSKSNPCALVGKDTAGRDVYRENPKYVPDGQWIFYERIGDNVVVLDPNVYISGPTPIQKEDVFQIFGSLEKQTPARFRQYLLDHRQGMPQ